AWGKGREAIRAPAQKVPMNSPCTIRPYSDMVRPTRLNGRMKKRAKAPPHVSTMRTAGWIFIARPSGGSCAGVRARSSDHAGDDAAFAVLDHAAAMNALGVEQ